MDWAKLRAYRVLYQARRAGQSTAKVLGRRGGCCSYHFGLQVFWWRTMMQLSDGEKLILMMLCEIYEKLQVNGEMDTKLVRSAILDGQLWALKWEMSGIFHGSEPTDEMVQEVCEIWDMWRSLERSYQSLSPEDKERVKKQAEPFGEYVQFRGFDGNNEGHYGCIARFLVEEMGRYREFKGRDMDSHMPLSLETYRRMLEAYKPLRASRDLTSSEIVKILQEKMHPERRKAVGVN
jgi:hypothetical protein